MNPENQNYCKNPLIYSCNHIFRETNLGGRLFGKGSMYHIHSSSAVAWCFLGLTHSSGIYCYIYWVHACVHGLYSTPLFCSTVCWIPFFQFVLPTFCSVFLFFFSCSVHSKSADFMSYILMICTVSFLCFNINLCFLPKRKRNRLPPSRSKVSELRCRVLAAVRLGHVL